MKLTILKKIACLVFMLLMTISCNTKTETQGGIEGSIENPPTSQDTVTSFGPSDATGDTANTKKVDATRMSNGKDSISGEVTLPNAQKQ